MGNCWSIFCPPKDSLVMNNKLKDEIKLLQKNHPSLINLRINEENEIITDHDAIAIATALRRNVHVQTLAIQYYFPLEGYYAVAKALEVNKSITRFDIGVVSNDITKATVIADMLRRNKTSFEELCLFSYDDIPITGVIDIMNAMSNNTVLDIFDLWYEIYDFTSDEIMIQLGQAMGDILRHNKKLTKMTVACCNIPYISDEAINCLASGLQINKTLQLLSLCAVSYEGVISIANALQYNTSLRKLHLSCDNLMSDAIIALFQALEYNETLDSLYLFGHLPNLDDEAVELILDSLQYNDTLVETSLLHTDIESYLKINSIIEKNCNHNRTAPRKGYWRRYFCWSWLLNNSSI